MLFSLEEHVVKKYLDQRQKDRNVDARNDSTTSGAPIRRKSGA